MKIQEEKEEDGYKCMHMGNSLAGNDVVRVYQVGGDTKTIEPGWKLFRVDRMNGFKKIRWNF